MVVTQEPKAPVDGAATVEAGSTASVKPDGITAVKKSIARTKGKAKKKINASKYKPKTPPQLRAVSKKKAPPTKPKKQKATLSVLDAAVKVLGEVKEPLGCTDLVTRMLDKGYWKTNGKTPQGTLYAAMLREIQTKGKQSRFKKAGKGKFKLA